MVTLILLGYRARYNCQRAELCTVPRREESFSEKAYKPKRIYKPPPCPEGLDPTLQIQQTSFKTNTFVQSNQIPLFRTFKQIAEMRFIIITTIFASAALAAPQFGLGILEGFAEGLENNKLPLPISSTILGNAGSVLAGLLELQTDIADALVGALPWTRLTDEQKTQIDEIRAAVRSVTQKQE
jgi:hypothetical protein